MSEILGVAKKVLRRAVGVGINMAGQSVCGPLWPFFKSVLTPAFEELEKRFPALFLKPEEADKAANALEQDSEMLKSLISRFDEEFGAIRASQDEIIAFLLAQNETLTDISATVEGIAGKMDEVDFKTLAVRVEQIYENMVSVSEEPQLSIEAIDHEVRALQADAMRWLEGGDLHVAQRRITEARRLIADGVKRDPNNASLYSVRGYVEKTQSQIHRSEGRYQESVSDMGKASDYFAAALKLDPGNIGAMNGVQNVALSARDYDTAVKLGRIVTSKSPHWGSGLWDFAIALDAMIARDGQMPHLVEELKGVYKRLLAVMSMRGSEFSAANQSYVERKLRELG